MYLTSFIQRDQLLDIAERWFCGHLNSSDALRLTQILICDGFVLAETLECLTKDLLKRIHHGPIMQKRVHLKGELREAICLGGAEGSQRAQELFQSYRKNPDFYYREAPIDGVMCLASGGQIIGLYRVKRARRIAEKANRKIANWIFSLVQTKAQQMAAERARRFGIPLELLLTPEPEMASEFIEAEKTISQSFIEGSFKFDRDALTIHDVGGIKIIADDEQLVSLENTLDHDPKIRVMDKEVFHGSYRAKSMILEYPWDAERIFRKYKECQCWERYLNRGIPERDLERGLESHIQDPKPTMNVELILSTFPDLVESEFGDSIHEERIIVQRDNKIYQGYIPMNVEFLLEYLFAVGFSPQIRIDRLPIRLWGRYLPDTLISHVRRLYQLPEHDLFY
jgi:hypothetical protein